MSNRLGFPSRQMLQGSRRTVLVLFAATALIASVTLGIQAGAGAGPRQPKVASVTITAELPDISGAITATDNAGVAAVTKTWEKLHPGVTVDWLPGATSGIPNNAELITEASGGDAHDIIFQETGPVDSVPAGILANLGPFLQAKDPYDTSYPNWLDTFSPGDVPYMKNSTGEYVLINASIVETGIFYNKAIFARAGISAPPTTYAQWIADMQAIKTKVPGVYPFFFQTGGSCNPSFWERTFSSMLLARWVKEINVNHQQVLTGLDLATGVGKNIISMKNPAYAEIWKLLGQLQPYLAPGGSQYDACADPSTTTPPLSAQSLLVKGKVAMLWGGSWWPSQLASLGFPASKWGAFPVPPLTKATTPYATGLNVSGVVGGPYGAGTWSLTTQRAANNMTPSTTALAVNFLEYLTSPRVINTWLLPESNGFSAVNGSPPPTGLGAVLDLVPKGVPPVTVEGNLDDVLTDAGTNAGLRIIEAYVGGSLSFSAFSSEWQANLILAAKQWAATNKVSIPGL